MDAISQFKQMTAKARATLSSKHSLYTTLSSTCVSIIDPLHAQVSLPERVEPLSRTLNQGEHVRAVGRGSLRHFHYEEVRTSRTSKSSVPLIRTSTK